MMDSVEYMETKPSDLIGKRFDNGFEIDKKRALALLKTYAPEKISDAVVSYTIDTIKGHTYLIGLTPNGYVDSMFELECVGVMVDNVDNVESDNTVESLSGSRLYVKLRFLCLIILAVLVVMAVSIFNIIY